MKNRLLKILALSFIIASVLSVTALADTTGCGTVKVNDYLNLRASQSTASLPLRQLPAGTVLFVEEKQSGWYKVAYDGVTGYVSSDYVDFCETMDFSSPCRGTVTAEDVNMRSGPSTASYVIGSFDTGYELDITGVSGSWLKVRTASGREGYIRSDFMDYGGGTPVSVSAAAPADVQTAPAPTPIGEQIISSAKNYLGTAYVWAGMSPGGFDCSGFVNYVYGLYGYSMYRVAQDIYSNNGTYVAKSDLIPGDLVFFGYSAYNVTHVGMYVGNGQFIHASSGAGKVVITDLSQDYYTRMYVGAKRIAN